MTSIPVKKVLEDFARQIYRKYPELIRVLEEWDGTCNQSLEFVKRLDEEGKALAFRPVRIAVKNQESNVETQLCSCEHGYADAEQQHEDIENFLTT